jgi:hypothetical protein
VSVVAPVRLVVLSCIAVVLSLALDAHRGSGVATMIRSESDSEPINGLKERRVERRARVWSRCPLGKRAITTHVFMAATLRCSCHEGA